MSAYSFMVRKSLKESELISCLDAFLDGGVDSILRRRPESNYFLVYCEFSEGFLGSVHLHGVSFDKDFDELSLVRHVACVFNTEVIFEPLRIMLPKSRESAYIDLDGLLYAVDVLDLEGGVDILAGSLLPLDV